MGIKAGGNKMKAPWMEMSVREFQSALASSSPTPGGGTAAAISLGQAAALTIMVCDLTIGKERWESGWDIANKALPICVKIMSRAGELADLDSNAFDDVMAAYRMPKGNEKEVIMRKESIKKSSIVATEVPFETSKLALEILEILPELALKGNGNAVSDVGVAGLLASAACKGALFNVDINLSGLSDDVATEIRKESPEILKMSRALSRKIMDNVRERL